MTAKYGLPYFQNFINSGWSPTWCAPCAAACSSVARTAQARQRSVRQRRADRQPGRGDHQLRASATCTQATKRAAGRTRPPDGTGQTKPGDQAQTDPAAHGPGPVPAQALPGHAAQPLQHAGVNGINEMVRNFTGDAHDITSERGHQLAVRLLDHVRERMTQFRRKPATLQPGGHARRRHHLPLCQRGQKRWPPSCRPERQISPTTPTRRSCPWLDGRPFEALARQEVLQSKYTGGTVLHLYMGERLSSGAACRDLVRSLTRFRLPYITITPTFLHLPHARLPGGRAQVLPHLRRRAPAGQAGRTGGVTRITAKYESNWPD